MVGVDRIPRPQGRPEGPDMALVDNHTQQLINVLAECAEACRKAAEACRQMAGAA